MRLLSLIAVSSIWFSACHETPTAPRDNATEKVAAPPTPETPAAPVVRLRPAVGDFVEYAANASSMSSQRPDRQFFAKGTLRLQAIEVTPLRTLVHVSSPDLRIFGTGLVFELLEAGSAPLADQPSGRPDSVTIDGKAWPCTRTAQDQSAGDGPKSNECAGSTDRALALGDGMVELNWGVSGLGGSISKRLTLLRTGNAPLPAPAPQAFPPGTWWTMGDSRRRVESAGGHIGIRDERGGRLDTLANFLLEVMQMDQRPKVPADAKPTRLKIGTRTVDALHFKFEADPFQKKRYDVFVIANPDALQAPLPVRFGVLQRGTGENAELTITDWND